MTESSSSGRVFVATLLLGADGLLPARTAPATSWWGEFWTAMAGRAGEGAHSRHHLVAEELPEASVTGGSTYAAAVDAEGSSEDWELPDLPHVVEAAGTSRRVVFGAGWQSSPPLSYGSGRLASHG